jgi:TonB family protein
MRKIILILYLIGVSTLTYSQADIAIKTEQKDKMTWKYYKENDTISLIKIYDKKERLSELRRYTDMTLNIETGEWTYYYKNGNVKSKMYFNNGFPVGIWTDFMSNGKVNKTFDYNFPIVFTEIKEHGSYEKSKSNDSIIVDQLPKFDNGDFQNFIYNYIAKNICINNFMMKKYEGSGVHKIYVQFSVDNDGSVTDAKVKNNGEKALEKDAVRLVRNSPKWTPGYQKGNPVKVRFTFPIIYVFP